MKPGFQNMEPRGEQHIVVKVILLNYIWLWEQTLKYTLNHLNIILNKEN